MSSPFALFDMPSRHRGAGGSAGVPEADWLVVVSIAVAVLGLLVLAAIAFSSWRAHQAIKQARKEWSSSPSGSRRGLVGEEIVRPNPLRKSK